LRVQRHKTGSIRFDMRRRTWNFLWCDGPTRRSKRISGAQVGRYGLAREANTHRCGIVEKVVGDVKTEGSARSFPLTNELLAQLKLWKPGSDFSGAEDWIFASPIKIGRFPYTYTGVWRELVRAASAAKIGHLGPHSFRHTHRSWLDAVGTFVAVQQR